VENNKLEELPIKTVSYSQYSMYKQCPHMWNLNYAKGLKVSTSSIYTVFGTAIHESIQNYLKVLFEEGSKEADNINLSEYFENRLIEIYKEESTKDGHFSSPTQLYEFYEDAVGILKAFSSERSNIFNKKNKKLIGIEVPILNPILSNLPNIKIKGFIDLVIQDTEEDTYTIYDIKTSTRGWSKEKEDQIKINQILLYKRYFSEIYNIPENKINVEFFIVRRKLSKNLKFNISRIQRFTPPNGKKRVQEAVTDFQSFVTEVFDQEGNYLDKEYFKNTNSCKYCPFKEKPDLCDKKNN